MYLTRAGFNSHERGNTLGRSERLKSRKLIGLLFSEGSSLKTFPLRLVWRTGELPHAVPVQAGFSVGKSSFKRAVVRNRIKRLLREAYRLNKSFLFDKLIAEQQQLSLMIIYNGRKIPSYLEIESALIDILTSLVKELDLSDVPEDQTKGSSPRRQV